MNGPIAAPLIDCRNNASLPETPWALDLAHEHQRDQNDGQPRPSARRSGQTRTRAGRRIRFDVFRITYELRWYLRWQLSHDSLTFSPDGQHLLGALRLRRLQRGLARLDEILRILDPVALVHGAAAHQQQVA